MSGREDIEITCTFDGYGCGGLSQLRELIPEKVNKLTINSLEGALQTMRTQLSNCNFDLAKESIFCTQPTSALLLKLRGATPVQGIRNFFLAHGLRTCFELYKKHAPTLKRLEHVLEDPMLRKEGRVYFGNLKKSYAAAVAELVAIGTNMSENPDMQFNEPESVKNLELVRWDYSPYMEKIDEIEWSNNPNALCDPIVVRYARKQYWEPIYTRSDGGQILAVAWN